MKLAFFKKDFTAGKQWETHEPEVTEIGEGVFRVKMSATYTSRNRHKIASAQSSNQQDEPDGDTDGPQHIIAFSGRLRRRTHQQ